jgi:hypothetical protein
VNGVLPRVCVTCSCESLLGLKVHRADADGTNVCDLAETSPEERLAEFQELSEVKSALKTMRAADQTKSFSTVSQQTAEKVLRDLRLKEVDGSVVDPIIVSDGVECTSFDMSRYHNEDEGIPHLMHHHQEQLSLCGLPFGRDGYAMYDARQIRCSEFMVSNQLFKGTTDCILAPCGLLGASPWTCMRVGFEHKRCRKEAVHAVSRCICGFLCPVM